MTAMSWPPKAEASPGRRAMSHVALSGGRPPQNNADTFSAIYEVGVAEETRQRYVLQSQQTITGRAAPLPSAAEARQHFMKEKNQ